MTAKSIVGGNNITLNFDSTHTNSISGFITNAGGFNDAALLSEAQAQIHSAAGTWGNLTLFIPSSSATATATFRKNGGNGNQTITTTSSGTGSFTDSVHTDTTSSGDLTCVALSSTGNTAVGSCTSTFDAGASTPTGYLGGICALSSSGTLVGTFSPFAGQWFDGQSSTETFTQLLVRGAGTWSDLEVYEQVAATWTFRKNGSNGNQNVPSSTGLQHDTTHTDTVASGDLVNLEMGSTSAAWHHYQCRITYSTTKGDLASATNPNSTTSSSLAFVPLLGDSKANATESNCQIGVPIAATFSNMREQIVSNSSISVLTMIFRKNGSNGNQTVTSTASSTGWFEDATHTDGVVAGDSVNASVQSSLLAEAYSMFAISYVAAGADAETAAVNMALGEVAFNADVDDTSFTRSAAMHLAGVSFAASLSKVETPDVTMHLGGVGFSAHVAGEETADVTMTLEGVSIEANVSDLSSVNKLRQFTTFG